MGATAFREARALLLARREHYDDAYREFRWPALDSFNWALDWFDAYARRQRRPGALRWWPTTAPTTRALSFAELVRARAARSPTSCARSACARGDRMLLMLPNVAPLWETMLAAMKLGAVVVPSTHAAHRRRPGRPHRARRDPPRRDRRREGAASSPTLAGDVTRIVVGAGAAGLARAIDEAYAAPAAFAPDGATRADRSAAALLHLRHHRAAQAGAAHPPELPGRPPVDHVLDRPAARATCTGTSARPAGPSTPGAASSRPGTRARPCSSINYAASTPGARSTRSCRCGVTTLCAPPTVWRMLIQEDLGAVAGRAARAGERRRAAQSRGDRAGARAPGASRSATATARPRPRRRSAIRRASRSSPARWAGRCPGYRIALLDADGSEADEGEIALALDPRAARPDAGLPGRRRRARRRAAGGFYRTGDVARRDADGYFTYVGRADDVFKSSDYRISPFELESALIEHPAVAEAAVVPSPDPLRLAVPKAFVVLRPGAARRPRDGPARSSVLRGTPGALQAGAPPRVRRAAEDDLGQDPPGRAAKAGGGAGPNRRARCAGVPRGGFPGAGGRPHLGANSAAIPDRGAHEGRARHRPPPGRLLRRRLRRHRHRHGPAL